jgi:hypothetical protein
MPIVAAGTVPPDHHPRCHTGIATVTAIMRCLVAVRIATQGAKRDLVKALRKFLSTVIENRPSRRQMIDEISFVGDGTQELRLDIQYMNINRLSFPSLSHSDINQHVHR